MIKNGFDKNKYNSPFKVVGGNEGDKCYYPTRLDTYGKGCYFNCKYCYAKSLLDFRGLWKPNKPAPSNIGDIKQIIKNIPKGETVRLGGMVDCFQPAETAHKITYKTIKLLNKKGIHQLIVTKNDMITRPEYMEILNPNLAHIQISIPSTENKILSLTDNAPSFERRKQAVETLQEKNFDISVRLSPFLYNYVNFDKINNINCNKILIEFLRVNNNIKKEMKQLINIKEYTHKENNYQHITLLKKIHLIKKINYNKISICEDCTQHYNYFKDHINYNPNDCCNLTFKQSNNNK